MSIIEAMRLDSGLFDSVRSSKSHVPDEVEDEDLSLCEWPGCALPASHKAPASREQIEANGGPLYHSFCLDHVRAYNSSYNYLDGMSDKEIDAFVKASVTGMRPTWAMGAQQAGGPNEWLRMRVQELLQRWRYDGSAPSKASPTSAPAKILPADRKALEILGFNKDEGVPSSEEIKARYKSLIKKFHPDTLSGNSTDGKEARADRLVKILLAHDHLKTREFL